MSEHYLQPEVHIVITKMPGVDGISSPARLTQIESDLSTMLGRPVILELADVPDVDADTPSDGDTIIYNDATGKWELGSSATPVAGWDDDVNRNTIVADVRQIVPRKGLVGVASGVSPNRYILDVVTGTTANTVAAGNHAHTQPLPTRVTTAPQGYLSGGSQSLGSTSVTLPDGIPCIVEAELTGQFRGADSGAAYYTLSINIGGNTFTSPGGTGGFWCVQGVPDKILWEHEQKITGAGTAVPVSASVAWHSGSGFNIDRTYLKVTVRRDR